MKEIQLGRANEHFCCFMQVDESSIKTDENSTKFVTANLLLAVVSFQDWVTLVWSPSLWGD